MGCCVQSPNRRKDLPRRLRTNFNRLPTASSGSHVGEDLYPHCNLSREGERKEHRLDAERLGDVLLQDAGPGTGRGVRERWKTRGGN